MLQHNGEDPEIIHRHYFKNRRIKINMYRNTVKISGIGINPNIHLNDITKINPGRGGIHGYHNFAAYIFYNDIVITHSWFTCDQTCKISRPNFTIITCQ